jgi:hypothetical protein
MAERPGESKRDESNTNDTNSRTTDIVAASGCEAVSAAREGLNKARNGEEYEAGASDRESSCAAAGAGSV